MIDAVTTKRLNEHSCMATIAWYALCNHLITFYTYLIDLRTLFWSRYVLNIFTSTLSSFSPRECRPVPIYYHHAPMIKSYKCCNLLFTLQRGWFASDPSICLCQRKASQGVCREGMFIISPYHARTQYNTNRSPLWECYEPQRPLVHVWHFHSPAVIKGLWMTQGPAFF